MAGFPNLEVVPCNNITKWFSVGVMCLGLQVSAHLNLERYKHLVTKVHWTKRNEASFNVSPFLSRKVKKSTAQPF